MSHLQQELFQMYLKRYTYDNNKKHNRDFKITDLHINNL